MDIALALVLTRLIGIGIAAHGAQKLFGWFGGYGIAGTGGFFEGLGFRPGRLFAAAAGVSEFAAGILILLGLGGPIGPMLLIATMVVAIFAVHIKNGFFVTSNGYELPLAYLVLSVIYAVVGYGAYSLDNAVGLSGVWTPAIGWAGVALGLLGGFANLALRRKPAPQQAAQA